MKTIFTCIALVHLLNYADALTCRKDACYYNVAFGVYPSPGTSNPPSMASRIADCYALTAIVTQTITSTVVKGSTVVTATATTTLTDTATITSNIFTATTLQTTVTQTSATTIYTFAPLKNSLTRRGVLEAIGDIGTRQLEARVEGVWVLGKLPKYITQCSRYVEVYGLACACWGKNPSATTTRTSTKFVTILSTATETAVSSTVTTATSLALATSINTTTIAQTTTLQQTVAFESVIANPQATSVSRVRMVGTNKFLTTVDGWQNWTDNSRAAAYLGFNLGGGVPFYTRNFETKMTLLVRRYSAAGDPSYLATSESVFGNQSQWNMVTATCTVSAMTGTLTCWRSDKKAAVSFYYCDNDAVWLMTLDSSDTKGCQLIQLELVDYLAPRYCGI